MITKEQINQCEELAKPLIKWMANNLNPHAKIIIDSTTAEIVEGLAAINTTEFIKK